jgi:ribosomal protein S18 acetylase RimI-like enzyme
MSEVEIRQAQWEDLEVLATALGQEQFFADRLTRQQRGRGALLTAWLDRKPIGDVYLWLEDAEEREIRQHLPGVPLLTHLEVVPEHRNHGIGTMLIDVAENQAREQGYERLALAVAVDNPKATRLYERLGYGNWNQSPVTCYPLGARGRERHAELCHVLVKRLVGALS